MIRSFSLLFACICLAFSGYSQSFQTGMEFDDEEYSQVPKKARLTRGLAIVPSKGSIKQYAPIPQSQGAYGTCTAWAAAYCGRTIMEAIRHNWTDKKVITKNAYSPAFMFRLLKPADSICNGGTVVTDAFGLLKEKGAIPFSELSGQCIPAVTEDQLTRAAGGKIKGYQRTFDITSAAPVKIQAVKKSISEKKPVVIGMICPPSFRYAKEVWEPKEEALKQYGGHAMVVVGFDDEKFGGAFEIQNSWGTTWGNEGYMWVRYNDFARFTRYGYEFIDLPESQPEIADLSGQIRLSLSDGKEMVTNLRVSSRGLDVVPSESAPGPLTIYQTAKPYSSGTRFRIYISNNQPAFVYAISTDLSNEITKIFPYEEGISAALTDKKNDVAIPDEDHFIEFDNKPGKDFLCVLYSREELDLNKLVQQIGSQSGSFEERIFKVIGEKMVDPKNIQFSKDKIAFNGFSRGKKIIPMMVELEHQ